jgi:malyl-CoA/(S)-citramalyl-CoA lyase
MLNKKVRINRSELAVPGNRLEFFDKAAKSNADIIFLDLEDSVALNEKVKARKNVIEAINELDWRGKVLSVRVNGYDTGFIEDDISDIIKNTSSKLDLLMFPKVSSANDVIKFDKLVSKFENNFKRIKKIGFEIIIENTLGLINVKEIALASKRNESLHFGAADFAASLGAKNVNIGGVNQNYGVLSKKGKNRSFFLNDMWHFALFQIVLTAHAFGLRAIDCPYGDFNDEKGFKFSAKSTYTLGFDGKMVIHPSQIDLANKIYSPTVNEIKEAKQILLQMKLAEKKGKGAIAFKGKLLDIVSIKQAENIINIDNMIKKVKN